MGSQLIPLAIQVLVIFTYRALQPKSINENMYGIQPADSANMSHVNLVVPRAPLAGLTLSDIPMQAENADSASWTESIPDPAGYVCA